MLVCEMLSFISLYFAAYFAYLNKACDMVLVFMMMPSVCISVVCCFSRSPGMRRMQIVATSSLCRGYVLYRIAAFDYCEAKAVCYAFGVE